MDTPPSPLWVQDWTDDSAYPMRFEEWDVEQWAGAFLRRNPEYQSDYAYFVSVPEVWPGTGDITPKWPGESMMDEWSMEFRYCNPPALPNETYREWHERCSDFEWEEMPLATHLTAKWWLSICLYDPADDDGWRVAEFEGTARLPYFLQLGPDAYGWTPPQPEPDEPYQVSLRFDVRFNIERQIKEAKAILLDAWQFLDKTMAINDKRRSSTPLETKLPVYLRAYDAFLAGVGPRELAAKICPAKFSDPASLRSADEEARRAIAVGQALVNGGYKELLTRK